MIAGQILNEIMPKRSVTEPKNSLGQRISTVRGRNRTNVNPHEKFVSALIHDQIQDGSKVGLPQVLVVDHFHNART